MAQEDYKEFICSRIGTECGFQIRAKTEAEIMEHAKMHATKAQGFKEIWPETEKKIKENIKTVSVDVPKKTEESIQQLGRTSNLNKELLLESVHVYYWRGFDLPPGS